MAITGGVPIRVTRWQGWGHWLGNGNVGNSTTPPLPFGEALAVARSLGLASMREWKVWSKEGLRPANMPADPPNVYENHGRWQGWGHWLGTGNTRNATAFLPVREALAVARSLGLPGRMEWQVWSKEGLRPPNVPSAPNEVCEDHGWQGWGHWLGTGNHASQMKQLLPFDEALAVARSLGLANRLEWQQWSKEEMRPPKVPSNPDKGGEWQGWGHWLGTGDTVCGAKEFLPFAEALAVARSLGLANRFAWKEWCKEGMRPRAHGVPSDPPKIHKDGGWQGWGHWLGTGNQNDQKQSLLPFDEALRVARSLRLASHKEWKLWCRSGARPANVPARPDQAHVHDGWFGWEHWLYHANLDAATAPVAARLPDKRPAAGGAGRPGESRGKRRRRQGPPRRQRRRSRHQSHTWADELKINTAARPCEPAPRPACRPGTSSVFCLEQAAGCV